MYHRRSGAQGADPMAGRGRGAEEGEGTTAGVSERLLFAGPLPDETAPYPVLAPRPAARGLEPGSDASREPSPAIIARARRLFRRASLSAFRRSVAAAAATELDRGVGFLLVP